MLRPIGQDTMTNEKPKEDYYREAAQYLNSGEKVAAESGEGVGGTLAFLTRGEDATNIAFGSLTLHRHSTTCDTVHG